MPSWSQIRATTKSTRSSSRCGRWYQPGIAGRTTAPAWVTRTMFSRWIRLSGVSRGTRISLRRSFRWTSAARVIRLAVIPAAIDASVLMLHGTMTIPPVRNDPLAIPAEKSRWW